MAMTPQERKAALVLNRVSHASLGRQLGVSRAMVSQVVAGDSRSARVEAAIAAVIDKPVDEVFPPTRRATALAS